MKIRPIKSLPKTLFVLLVSLVVISFFIITPNVNAAQTGTVSATVTAAVFSVSIADGSVSFGTIAQNSTANTTSTGVNDSQTATNDGTTAAKLNIKAADTTDWNLASTAGTDDYTMDFCVSDCDGSPTWVETGIDPSYVQLAASVAVSGSQVFDLRVGTPSSTSVTDQQSITVTIQATAP